MDYDSGCSDVEREDVSSLPPMPPEDPEPCHTAQRSTLLELPAELRNQIWAHALREDHIIDIKPGISVAPPAWTVACKQIHAEAFKLWFLVNNFRTDLIDFDNTHTVRFDEFLVERKVTLGRFDLHVWRSRNWANLLKWCKRMHNHGRKALAKAEKESQSLGVSSAQQGPPCSIRLPRFQRRDLHFRDRHTKAVFTQARKASAGCGKLSWEECVKVLEHVRVAVGSYDPSWLK